MFSLGKVYFSMTRGTFYLIILNSFCRRKPVRYVRRFLFADGIGKVPGALVHLREIFRFYDRAKINLILILVRVNVMLHFKGLETV